MMFDEIRRRGSSAMVSSLERTSGISVDAALHREIMRLRQVDNHTNLIFWRSSI